MPLPPNEWAKLKQLQLRAWRALSRKYDQTSVEYGINCASQQFEAGRTSERAFFSRARSRCKDHVKKHGREVRGDNVDLDSFTDAQGNDAVGWVTHETMGTTTIRLTSSKWCLLLIASLWLDGSVLPQVMVTRLRGLVGSKDVPEADRPAVQRLLAWHQTKRVLPAEKGGVVTVNPTAVYVVELYRSLAKQKGLKALTGSLWTLISIDATPRQNAAYRNFIATGDELFEVAAHILHSTNLPVLREQLTDREIQQYNELADHTG